MFFLILPGNISGEYKDTNALTNLKRGDPFEFDPTLFVPDSVNSPALAPAVYKVAGLVPDSDNLEYTYILASF